MKLGLIGIGNIGVHFCNRLQAAGHDLMVYDIDPEAMRRARETKARAAASPLDLANQCEVVLLSLPRPSVVAQVAIGDKGVIHGEAVRTVVDLSTTGPSVTEEISRVLEAKGIDFVGAPVSGGTVAAELGNLTVMPAGKEDVVKALEPIFLAIAKNIFYLGAAPGLGQTMKIINNTLYAASLIASCEALVYGVKAGLEAQTMLDVVNASSGRSFATQERIPQCVLNRNFPLRFTTELLHKDVKLCIEEAEKLGVPMQMGSATRQFLAFAITQGDGDKDNACIILHFEGWAGVQFGSAPASRT